jgi:hypothetical protein
MDTTMSAEIGRIVRLQVHSEPLKRDGAYVPDPLVAVDRAVINADGMLGWGGTGWIVDTHHRAHPRAKGGGNRVLSIGFTGHYAAMSDRFDSVPLGVAGENIIVDGPAVSATDIVDGVLIRHGDGTETLLRSPQPAIACVGFTSFLLGSDELIGREEIADHLSFLSTGTRGFILSVEHLDRPVEISVGDEVVRS